MTERFPPRFGAADRSRDRSESHPFDPSRGDGRMTLDELFGPVLTGLVQAEGVLRFQATGDTGVGTQDQHDVANAMAKDLHLDLREKGPLFLLNLGDLAYGSGKRDRYSNCFYRPYQEYIQAPRSYDAAVLAIPGNHDGETRSETDKKSQEAYLENFCQPPGSHPPLAESFGVPMPAQPGPYWWLDAPFLDLVGLYSNAKENEGRLGADEHETHQQDWLHATLTRIGRQRDAGAPRKALVMAVHHPPFGRGLRSTGPGHPSSPGLLRQIDAACEAARVWPDIVLSGHSHSYQRYMRRKDLGPRLVVIPHFVVGTGGHGLEDAPSGIGHEADGVAYENGLRSFGYVRVSAEPGFVTTTFVRTEGTRREEFETVQIDLVTGQRTHPPA